MVRSDWRVFFTSLLGTALLLITGRYFRTEAIVKERTEELRKEILVRKKAENDQKIAVLKAESANNAKSLFLSNISHELRTPLNGILGFTQLLKKDQSLPSNNREMIEIIGHCGDYLLTLINDILDISKIESNKIKIESYAFDFFSLIYDIIAMFKLSANQKNIGFVTHFSDSLPKFVMSDEKRLRQIIVNLLSNAVKFTEQGEVSLSLSYHKEVLHLTVSDTGCGIANEDKRKIFKPFFQIGKPVGTDQGTGLGLAITSQLVELMGGTLSVESEIGLGSVFSVSLPLLENYLHPESLSGSKKIIGFKGCPPSILIVDDNADNLYFLKCLLQDLGFIVSGVNDEEGCLDYCSQKTPDLVFMDMLMPGMNGKETIRRLLKMNPSLSQRVIGMSASVFNEEKQSFLNAGCTGFVSKPIKQEEVLSRINSILNLHWIYEPKTENRACQTKRILIADDNEINCLLLKNVIEFHGFQMDIANCGKSALELLLTTPYDSALIDLNMPVLNGFEVVKAVRESKGPNRQLKMAAISAYAEKEKVAFALKSGFDEFLFKPIDDASLKKFLFAESPFSTM